MKNYIYRAKKSPTEIKEGVIQAESEEEVIAQVNDMGLVVVHIEEQTASSRSSAVTTQQVKVSAYRGLLGHAVTRFYKQLGRVIQSGIPILQALKLMSEQADNAHLKQIIEEIQKNVAEGLPVSQALARYPEYFSPFDLAMIEAGEMVGHLDDSLKRIALHREAQEKIMSKIRGALAYPIFVCVAGFAAVVFMLAFVMPKFSMFFLSLGQELPLPTRILIATSQLAEKGWIVIVALAATAFFVIRQSLQSQGNQMGWHRFYLGLPKVGRLIHYSQFSRFARTLSLLLESGIPLVKALQTTLPVITNQVIRAELQTCQAALVEGGSLGESFRRSEWVPSFVTQLVRAGEEAGRLQESLNDVADWYEQELQESTEVMTKLLEPILILSVGAVLGLMIIAVLLPIFSMNAAIS